MPKVLFAVLLLLVVGGCTPLQKAAFWSGADQGSAGQPAPVVPAEHPGAEPGVTTAEMVGWGLGTLLATLLTYAGGVRPIRQLLVKPAAGSTATVPVPTEILAALVNAPVADSGTTKAAVKEKSG